MSWLSRTLKAVGLHIRTTLVAGVLIILPIAVTFLLLKFVFDFFDPVLKPVFEYAINRYTPGMGIIALVFIIYLAGVVTHPRPGQTHDNPGAWHGGIYPGGA